MGEKKQWRNRSVFEGKHHKLMVICLKAERRRDGICQKFFDNVPQDKLMSYVGRVIHDGDTESLIRKYLKAGVMNKGKYEATDIGTPQGGNLSPLLSNIMLNELDKELESRGQRFTRYADDVVIVLKSKAAATRVMHSITDWIERKLGLKVNATKTKITPPSKLKYLGFGFWKGKEGWKARPHQDSIMKFKRKLKVLCKRNWGNHYQFVATKSVITRAISKEILTKRGLISISDYYQRVAHI